MTDRQRSFHISLHLRPPGSWSSRDVALDGQITTAVDIPPAKLDAPFPVTFEQACQQLSQLPRLFLEPDGSLVWVSDQDAVAPWQIDGMLYDRNERLLYVELKGTCSPDAWKALLACCGCPPGRCVVQWVRQAVLIDEDQFFRSLFSVYPAEER